MLSLKKWSCVIGTALLPDMDDFTICWLYEWKNMENETIKKDSSAQSSGKL